MLLHSGVARWDRLGVRNGAARCLYAENRRALLTYLLRTGASPHQIRLRSGLDQGLFLLDQLLPNLPMFWLVSVVLKFGHLAAQNDQLFQ
jgi:hypothetical protein